MNRGKRPGSDQLRQWQALQLSKIELELQQQALTALQENSDKAQADQALYQQLFELSPACSYALDEAGCVVSANQAGAALLAQSAAALKGQPFERYLEPEQQPRWRAFAADLRSGSGQAGMETQLFAGIPGSCAVRIDARCDPASGLCCLVITPQAVSPGRGTAGPQERAAFGHALEAAEQLTARLEGRLLQPMPQPMTQPMPQPMPPRRLRQVKLVQPVQPGSAPLASQMAEQVAERTAALARDNAQLRLLVEHEANALETARMALANAVHDQVGQNLLALRIEASLLDQRTRLHDGPLRQRASAALQNVDATLRSVRTILNQLRPAVLDLGLQAAVDWQLAEFRKRSGLVCTLDVPDEQVFDSLESGAALMLFRQLQAVLGSVQRDGGASAVAVSLRRLGGSGVLLLVTDDGVGDGGVAAVAGRRQRQALAMLSIGERLRSYGGALEVDYGAGQGCRVSMRLPGRHS